MEMAEAIAVAAVAKEEACWYCDEPQETGASNQETADPETSDDEAAAQVSENNENNDASKLGTALGNRPSWSINNPLKPQDMTAVVPAAHHCIPGGASLAKATSLHDFMRQGGSLNLSSDIGYNVNDSRNGVWLPGNYAVREGNPEFNSTSWSAQSPGFQKTYVKSAMTAASGLQFHDAHRKYNGKVKTTLESIASKLQEKVKGNCPICNKPNDKTRPPFGLVGRLHRVSEMHRVMLKAPTKETVKAGYYTSSKVKLFF